MKINKKDKTIFMISWRVGLVVLVLTIAGVLGQVPSGNAQQPTVAIPTVTGTPTGPIAVVISDPEDQINVRSGPDITYPKIGVLINRQEVPALAKTEGGAWVKIAYPGAEGGVAWVYAPLVRVYYGELPIVPKPPTPTPLTTPTIDPTLASQFVAEIPPTRKPTFTPAPALVLPTYETENVRASAGDFPMGLVIVGLVSVGIFSLFVSLLRES
jgi:hypothetical protein